MMILSWFLLWCNRTSVSILSNKYKELPLKCTHFTIRREIQNLNFFFARPLFASNLEFRFKLQDHSYSNSSWILKSVPNIKGLMTWMRLSYITKPRIPLSLSLFFRRILLHKKRLDQCYQNLNCFPIFEECSTF